MSNRSIEILNELRFQQILESKTLVALRATYFTNSNSTYFLRYS